MIKRKRVYICDHCGAVALEEPYFFMTDVWKGAPEGWPNSVKKICAQHAQKCIKDLWRK